MTELDRKIDRALSLYRDEPVPTGFSSRVRARLADSSKLPSTKAYEPAPKLRAVGGRPRRPSWLLAAAALVLGAGVMWGVLRATDQGARDQADATHQSATNQSAINRDAALEPLLAEVPADLLPHVEFLATLDDDSFEVVMDGAWSPDGLLADGSAIEGSAIEGSAIEGSAIDGGGADEG